MHNEASADSSRSKTRSLPAAPSPAFHVLLGGLIGLAGFFAFANSFKGTFIFDDEGQIVGAENIRHLWPISNWLSRSTPRPVVTLSLAINYALGGLNPWGYHFVNLAIHLCAAWVLYEIVRRTVVLCAPFHAKSAPWLALVIALFWTVHPLQTQSVTYMIQRSESLMGLFFLLCLYFVILAESSGQRNVWYALSIASCLLGMGTKAAMICAPAVVFFYDYLILTNSLRQTVRRRGGLYLGLIAASGVVLWYTGLFSSLLSPDPGFNVTVGFGLKEFTPWQYLSSQPGVILHYLRLVFWPDWLCIDYEWPIPITRAEVIAPAIPIAGLLVATLWACWRKPWLGFIGIWFFAALAPTSSVMPVRDPAMEHRMYLPLAAVIAATVIGARFVLIEMLGGGASAKTARVMAASLLVLIVTMGLSLRTRARNHDYRSTLAMWQNVLESHPRNARAWVNYGEAFTRVALQYQGVGATAKADEMQEQAASAFRKSIEINPKIADAHYNLGNALQALLRLAEAEKEYLRALEIDPREVPSHIMLGNVYMDQENLTQAESEFRAAIAAATSATDRTTVAKAHYNLGNTLARRSKLDAAIEQYRLAIQVQPAYDKAHYGLGWALAGMDQFEEAEQHYIEAVKLNPGNVEARTALDALAKTIEARRRTLKRLDEMPVNQPIPSAKMPSNRP